MFPPRRAPDANTLVFIDESVLLKALEARLPALADSGISKREAHVYTGAYLALDDHEPVAEPRHEAESDPESGAVVARRHSDAIVADDDPDALGVLGQP
jgi:hypothetical protein